MMKCTNYSGESAYIVHVTPYTYGLGTISSNVVHLFSIKGARSYLESSHRKAGGFFCVCVCVFPHEKQKQSAPTLQTS